MTGSLATRPGMQAILAYLRKHSKKGKQRIVVIIDDISRLARGIEAHLKLRTAIVSAGGILKSPTIEFGEDSDSILVENLLASVSQHQRQKNGEQTINRMRARTMNATGVLLPRSAIATGACMATATFWSATSLSHRSCRRPSKASHHCASKPRAR